MMRAATLGLLRHERGIIIAVLALLIALSWLYLVRMAEAMDAMPAMPSGVDPLPTFVMWLVMMAAMMLPSAAPAILGVEAAARRGAGAAGTAAYAFTGGYLGAWAGYSALATLGQWGLQELALLSPGMALIDPRAGGVVLVAAGVFQWTPMKRACLRYCRSPLGLLAGGFPSTAGGLFWLGLRNGTYCIGCCWALMALMFVGGVMSLLWMVLLTVVILIEKALPFGERAANLGGLALVLAGLWLLVAA